MAITLPTRDELVQRYQTNYVVRVPGAKTGDNTLVGIDARQAADVVLPIYAEAARLGKLPSLDGLTRDELMALATQLGLPPELPAVGASGFVQIVAASGGTTILAGAQLTNQVTGLRYACAITAVYQDGDQVPVYGVDTGPGTNVAAGTPLTWASPSAGLSPSCTVVLQADGSGLSGGADLESTDGIKDRIRTAYGDPAVAGNSAAYRATALRCPGLSVQAVWTYPCIRGPGTTGLAFTLRHAQAGATRIPSGAQIATMAAWLVGQFPADDGLFVCTLVAVPTVVYHRVRWTRGASGWTDATPWPVYDASHFTVSASPAPTPTTFRVASAMVSAPSPQAGQTIALYDAANGVFVRKRILSVSGASSPWDLTIDTSLNVSDTVFTPASGDNVCPWSDSLNLLAPVLLAEFDGIGPGEQVASFFDVGGMRERRDPPATATPYSSELTGRVLTPLYDLASVDDVQIVEPTLPLTPAAGTAGVSSNLLTLKAPMVYPL